MLPVVIEAALRNALQVQQDERFGRSLLLCGYISIEGNGCLDALFEREVEERPL